MHHYRKHFILKHFFPLALILVFIPMGYAVADTDAQTSNSQPLVTTIASNPQYFCPQDKNLVKDGLWWSSHDGAWKCYTQSFAKSIDAFIGAQWVGVKVGKIICLYRGKEGTDFPIALERVHVKEVLEPSGVGWSALVRGYKFCRSSNVADCPFYIKPTETVGEIYEQIKYTGGEKNADEGNF
jgi:hypothetical protein